MTTFTIQDLYAAYPDSDLLPIDPPEENETAAAFLKRTDRHCGDGLFTFLADELFEEDVDLYVQRDRLYTAMADISAVLRAVLHKINIKQPRQRRKE